MNPIDFIRALVTTYAAVNLGLGAIWHEAGLIILGALALGIRELLKR